MAELEERKLKEIEHSRQRREILQGYERIADTHVAHQADDLDALIKDKEAFDYHFANMKYYAITALSDQYQKDWLKEKCNDGVKVLDFACGNGENGVFSAQCGAEAIGIDISPEGVENANKNAAEAGVDATCRFEVMDGENMSFDDDMFDLGVEYGALHHVDLPKALDELRRVLKPTGEMICVEALRHNPLIHWYRKRTPHLRTKWEVEHILGVESLDLMREYFGKVDVKFFHLAALGAVPFRKTFLFDRMLSVLNKIDGVILKSHAIGKYAWIMVTVMSEPKKP